MDTDPGVGNGTAFTSSGADSSANSPKIPSSSLSVGYHRVYIRYEDSSRQVGEYRHSTVLCNRYCHCNSGSPGLRRIFLDTIREVGNGTGFTSSGADSSTNSITIATGSLTAGGHTVFARYRDSTGKWGQTQGGVFYVCVPPPGPITGTTSTCPAGTIALSDTTAGTSHSWSSSNTLVATVGSTGVVSGVAGGIATISYTVSVACGTVNVIATVTVNPLLIAGTIAGASAVCVGFTTALSDSASGGTWQSSNTGTATVNSSGVVSGVR